MRTPTIAILAALGGLQAAVAQHISSTAVWVDAATCDPWAKSYGFPAAAGPGGLFTTALDILVNISHTASYRIYNSSKQSPTTLPANVLAWERYRLNSTFDAFFGNNTGTEAFELGIWDVAIALWGVQLQMGSVDGSPYIVLVCDDAPYLSKESNGTLVYTDPYNHAKLQLGIDPIRMEVITTCATNVQSSYSAYSDNNWTQNIILCTKNMNLPLGFTSNGPTTFASGTTLDVAGKSWLGALYTQALWAFGCVFSTPPTHGFAAAHALRNNKRALWVPDSNKLFAFALMLDGLFWGSGVGRTSQQEYTNLQKTAAGKGIIAAFGLTDIAVPARGITWASGWTPPDISDPRPIEAIPTA